MPRRQLRKYLIGEFTWKRPIRSVGLVYAAVSLYLFFFADGMIFLPPPPSYTDDTSILKIPSSQGRTIAATYLPKATAKYTILYSHGNATDLGQLMPTFQILNEAGFSVFAYDYQGYGLSEGRPTEHNTYQDIEAAYQYLVDDLNTPPENIIVYGRSVGGGPSTYLAAQQPTVGLILESTFTKAFQVVVPIKLLPFEKFPNIDRLKQVRRPVLIIHGTADNTIPFEHGKQLYETANAPKQFVAITGADHNDLIWTDEITYVQAIQTFAESLP
ncbi:MAG: alpha/beta hydrolase [Cyanobacteria bacterium J06554_6]